MADRWTQDALFCEETRQSCEICPVHRVYGLSRPGHGPLARQCQMPAAVSQLKAKGVPKPKEPLEYHVTQGKYVREYHLGFYQPGHHNFLWSYWR